MGEAAHVLFSFDLFGFPIEITSAFLENLVIQWAIMAIIIALAIYFTRKLEVFPNKKQSIAEIFVDFINNLVEDNMGKEYMHFVPYIGSLAIFLVFLNLSGLVGVEPPTSNLGVTAGLAIMSFFIVQGYAIRKGGVKHYLHAYKEPVAFIAPLNVIERLILPLSLSLRLFGNMFAAVLLINLMYSGLNNIGFIAQLGAPIVAHAYFDIFDGLIQTYIFIMLTMVNIKIVAEE